LTKSDISSIIKTAAKDHNSNGTLKNKINPDDLVTLWKRQGYSTDRKDIVSMLKKSGFSDAEISNTFTKVGVGRVTPVSGKSGSSNNSKNTASNNDTGEINSGNAVQDVAEFINKNDELKKEIIDFMAQTYGFTESFENNSPLLYEDIRKIFQHIVEEERTELPELLRQFQMENLGRMRK